MHVDKSICVFKKIQSCYCSDIRLIPLLLQRQSFNDICNKQQWNEGTHVLNHKAINLCIYLNHAYIFNFIIVVIRTFYSKTVKTWTMYFIRIYFLSLNCYAFVYYTKTSHCVHFIHAFIVNTQYARHLLIAI